MWKFFGAVDPELQEDARKAAGLKEVIEARSLQCYSKKLTRALNCTLSQLLSGIALVLEMSCEAGNGLEQRTRHFGLSVPFTMEKLQNIGKDMTFGKVKHIEF